MSGHPFVVLADHVAGFETLAEAREYALANPPCVICERRRKPDGTSILVEVLRHDFLYDSARREWRVMMG
jgi:hypothetical protein